MGLWGPEAAVTEEEDEDEEEEAGARRSGPGLAGQRLRGKGRRGRVASPAGRPDTLSRRGAGERAGCLGAGDRGLRHSDRHSPLGRGRAAPGMATSRPLLTGFLLSSHLPFTSERVHLHLKGLIKKIFLLKNALYCPWHQKSSKFTYLQTVPKQTLTKKVETLS